jgi:hypothetical protein
MYKKKLISTASSIVITINPNNKNIQKVKNLLSESLSKPTMFASGESWQLPVN